MMIRRSVGWGFVVLLGVATPAAAADHSVAPPCRDGRAACDPWERAWRPGNGPQKGDVITPNGRILRQSEARLEACFTPAQDCTGLIVSLIDEARRELLVQAYGFTSTPIIAAIARAKARGVKVGVILDRSNASKRYTGATYLVNHGITPLIDYTVSIAHNKVIISDNRTVITGSFNLTKAAQERNAENVLVVRDGQLATVYRANWKRQEAVSKPYRR